MVDEKKFWEYVGKMGYPTSAKGLRYSSKEKKLLDDLRWFYHLKKESHEGAYLGYAAGSSLSRLASEYWDANLAFIRITEGEEAVIEKIVEIIKENVKTVKIYAKSIMDNDLMDWVEEGGAVDIDDIISSMKCSYTDENDFKCMHDRYKKLFGEEMENRIMRILWVLEISEQGIDVVKKNFDDAKNKARSAMQRADRVLRKLAKKAGVDYEELIQKLL